MFRRKLLPPCSGLKPRFEPSEHWDYGFESCRMLNTCRISLRLRTGPVMGHFLSRGVLPPDVEDDKRTLEQARPPGPFSVSHRIGVL